MKNSLFETSRPGNYLRRIADSDVGRRYKAIAIEQLQIESGNTVVDLGCGPGADVAAMAECAGPTGRVIGIDSDAAALAEAHAAHSADSRIMFRCNDIHKIPLDDNSVDRVHTDRVLQHVAMPETVLNEIHRILRPRGTAVFAEPDWDTLVVDHQDRELSRAYTRFVADAAVRNGTIGRRLPALAVRHGFAVPDVLPITTVFRDLATADHVFGFARVCERAIHAGHLTRDESERWLLDLAGEPFFASVTLFITRVTRNP